MREVWRVCTLHHHEDFEHEQKKGTVLEANEDGRVLIRYQKSKTEILAKSLRKVLTAARKM